MVWALQEREFVDDQLLDATAPQVPQARAYPLFNPESWSPYLFRWLAKRGIFQPT